MSQRSSSSSRTSNYVQPTLRMITWNISQKNKHAGIKGILDGQDPHIVILQEATKEQPWNANVKSLLYQGLVLMWDEQHVKRVGQISSEADGKNKCIWSKFELVQNSGISFIFFGVYGDSEFGLKLSPILNLLDKNISWVIMGDFNLTVDTEDERNYKSQSRDKAELVGFKVLLSKNYVFKEDYDTIYTHVNNSKLDWIVGNLEFSKLFKRKYASVLSNGISDHFPVYYELKYEI